jgi:hypothetical protein
MEDEFGFQDGFHLNAAREMEAGRDIVSWEKISSFGWHFGSRRLKLLLETQLASQDTTSCS